MTISRDIGQFSCGHGFDQKEAARRYIDISHSQAFLPVRGQALPVRQNFGFRRAIKRLWSVVEVTLLKLASEQGFGGHDQREATHHDQEIRQPAPL
jgi:hypothetical protein